jgi:hypothetical protein
MKRKGARKPRPAERRRFVALLSGLGALGAAYPFVPRRQGPPEELSLREADFYRPHDLAG